MGCVGTALVVCGCVWDHMAQAMLARVWSFQLESDDSLLECIGEGDRKSSLRAVCCVLAFVKQPALVQGHPWSGNVLCLT